MANKTETQTCNLSRSTARDRGLKGVGTKLYIDPDDCWNADETTLIPDGSNVFFEFCCPTELTPPGIEFDEEQDDGCLCDDEVFIDLGPLRRTTMSMTLRDSFHKAILGNESVPAGLTTLSTATADTALRTSIECKRKLAIAISYCGPGFICWEFFDMRISRWQPQSITKRAFRESQISIVPCSRSYGAIQNTDIDPFVFPAGLGTLANDCGGAVAQ